MWPENSREGGRGEGKLEDAWRGPGNRQLLKRNSMTSPS